MNLGSVDRPIEVLSPLLSQDEKGIIERATASGLPVQLLKLQHHDCLLSIMEFLSWEDLNVFSLASKGCNNLRNHTSLDQTRSGEICLGKGVSNAKELMEKIKEEHWCDTFSGHRTHLRLSGLTHLSSNIDPIDEDFINQLAPLKQVTTLDCSMGKNNGKRKSWLSPFEDYIDKGFAQGLTLWLLAPNLREIDMSNMPLTLLGVAWLAENNPKLEVLRWERSLIWPINNDACDHLKACQNLKEMYLDDARFLFCAGLNPYLLWTALSVNNRNLERVSIRRARFYCKGLLSPLSQESLMKFVRKSPSLMWFRSDLTPESIAVLQKEKPGVIFCS